MHALGPWRPEEGVGGTGSGVTEGHVGDRGHLTEAESLLSPRGTQGLNSGHWAWQRVPLPTKPTHWSLEMHYLFFKICVVVNFSFNTIIVKSADTLFGVRGQFSFNLV